MIYYNADESIKEHLNRYQIGMETSMKCREFIFDCIYLFYYKCHKINLIEVDRI